MIATELNEFLMPDAYFSRLEPAAPDPILGLNEAFKKDPRQDKINLSVGVYKDETGSTPILDSVREAEAALLENLESKVYKPMSGDPVYNTLARKLLLGETLSQSTADRCFTVSSPGGTGGLRVVADTLSSVTPSVKAHFSDPTWANHHAIFNAAGVETVSYPYYDKQHFGLDFDSMIKAVRKIPRGDALVLHGCCHNPTGVDLSGEQWQQIGELVCEHGLLPIVDFAYHGFARGLDEDSAGIRRLLDLCPSLIVIQSFSKTFGLYNERVGAVTFFLPDAVTSQSLASHVNLVIRQNYSNPPSHGPSLVKTILSHDPLAARWRDELASMRQRINQTRKDFSQALTDAGVSLSEQGNRFIESQTGMFSFSGLGKEQVSTLREEHGIYIVGSGRINVAGITPDNLPRLVECVAKVV